MTRGLDGWTRWGLRRPRALAAVVTGLTLLAGVALARVELITDVTSLLHTPGAQTLQRLERAFGLGQRAFLLVESPAPDAARLVRAGRALQAALDDTEVVAAVRIGPPVSADEALDALLLPAGPLFFGPEDLPRLRRLLGRGGMEAQLTQQAERLALLGLGELDDMVERDPLDLHRPLVRRVKSLEGSLRLDPESPYTLSADQRALLVEVEARGDAGTAQARAVVAALEGAAARVLAEPWADGLRIRGAGAAFLAEESERVIQADLIRGLSVSVVLAAVLTALVLRMRLAMVLPLLLPTLLGAFLGVGLFAALQTELAVVSLACTSILLGLGVDFTVHLAAATRCASAPPGVEAALEAVRANRGALALAALTSGVAFLAFLSSAQDFLRELGLLTSLGLLTCLLGALVALPPILARLRPAAGQPLRDLGVVALTRFATQRPGLVVAGAAALSALAVAALVARPVALEGDLRRIHAANSQPLAAQRAIAEAFGGSQEAVLLLVSADDAEAALAALHRLDVPLRRLIGEGVLAARMSLAALVPPRDAQAEVLALLAEHDPQQVAADFRAALDAVGFAPEPFAAYAAGLSEAVAQREPFTAEDLDRLGLGALRAALLQSVDGQALALVQVYPARDPWQPAERDALLAALAAAAAEAEVDARPTGLHVVSSESAAEVAGDFTRICLLTAGAVLLVLVLRLRHPLHVLLALTPAALGTLWTAGVLAATGTRLNLMNLGVLPMVLAIGIDDGIHLLHRYLRGEGRPDVPAFRATCAAVLLTSLTTMLTFGSLGLSRNQGIASVGMLTVVGVGGSLLASVLVFPALLRWFPAQDAP